MINNVAILAGYLAAAALWIFKGSGFIHKATEAFKKIDHIDHRLNKVESYLHELGGYMGKADKKFPKLRDFNLVQANSPLTLTEQGESLIADSRFDLFVQKTEPTWAAIATVAKGRGDAESYIEKHVIKEIDGFFERDDVQLIHVSKYIYDNGLRESKTTINEVMRAFGICARDFTMQLAGITPPLPPHRADHTN